MNPRQHCRISVRRWGGVESDYYPIHEFIDSTKALCADGKQVDVKDMCERDHLLADYGNRRKPIFEIRELDAAAIEALEDECMEGMY